MSYDLRKELDALNEEVSGLGSVCDDAILHLVSVCKILNELCKFPPPELEAAQAFLAAYFPETIQPDLSLVETDEFPVVQEAQADGKNAVPTVDEAVPPFTVRLCPNCGADLFCIPDYLNGTAECHDVALFCGVCEYSSQIRVVKS